MLDLNFDITHLRGAEYNPREITPDDLAVLAESIKELGLVKPLIVRGDLLIAGHQRTKSLRALGINTAAVFKLSSATTVYDETRFNQLHNGTDMDSGDENCHVSGLVGCSGFHSIPSKQIRGNFRARMAGVRREICELILKYGAWGGCVATESGTVIHCAQYALACASVGAPLTVFVIPDSERGRYERYLNRTYGVFSYKHLERKTYIQTFAQLPRLRQSKLAVKHSRLYENLVLPFLGSNNGKSLRGIDFGSGHADYAEFLRARGYPIIDVELFRRQGAGNTIDTLAVHRMIDVMCRELTANGPFDYVVCDSVLNSVDCLAAETAVMTFISALCKPGGTVFFSGRCSEYIQSRLRCTQSASGATQIWFLDHDGFTAKYRKGEWFYQKFHDKAGVVKMAAAAGLKLITHQRSDSSWQVQATPTVGPSREQLVSAIRYEFELMLPGGVPLGRSADVIRAFNLE